MDFDIDGFSKSLDYIMDHAEKSQIATAEQMKEYEEKQRELLIKECGIPQEYLEKGNSIEDFMKKRNEDFKNKLKERLGIDE